MGNKGKGQDAGSAKKPKAPKVGNRPHEQRQRESLKAAGGDPGKPTPAQQS